MGLAEYRKEVEDIDEKIIRLIDQRVRLAKNIFEAKRSEGRGISDPERERHVQQHATDLATELNLDAGAINEIFSVLIRMSIQKQHELQGKNQG